MFGKSPKGLFAEELILETDSVLNTPSPIVIFLVKSSSLSLVKAMARLIQGGDKDKTFIAFICPRCTVIVKEIIDSMDAAKKLTIHELMYELIPLEKDVLTLNDPDSFKGLLLGTNYMSLTLVKHSIQRLEALYGKIPLKYAKGAWSCSILDSLGFGKEREPEKANTEDEPEEYSEIDAIVLIDRLVDPYTPLLTQQTYEGMIDEFYGIGLGYAMIDESVFKPEISGPTGKIKLPLTNSVDYMFEESRDLHFNMMKVQFPKKYQEVKSLLDNKEKVKKLEEITEYMTKLKNLNIPKLEKALNTRKFYYIILLDMNLSSAIDKLLTRPSIKRIQSMEPNIIFSDRAPQNVMEFLELEMTKCTEKTRLLRLLCLLSLTQNGIPKEFYAIIAKEIVEAFGLSEFIRLINMERCGFLKRTASVGNWSYIRKVFMKIYQLSIKAFRLIVEDPSIEEPTDIAYSYRGYAPLSVRLVDRIFTGWNNADGNIFYLHKFS